MNKKITTISVFAIALSSLVLSSCNSGSNKENESNLDTAAQNVINSEARKVFYSLPSPIELSSLLQKSGAKFDKTMLHDLKAVEKYTTNDTKALNLGVYGSDLSYTSVFDQTQETMLYLKAAQKLSDALGISSAFNKSTIERIEANLNNKDSLMNIISDSYLETDAYLAENERQNLSALIIAGGWIEGLHLATKTAQVAPKNEALLGRIAEQKLSLDNLIGLLSAYPNDGAIADVIKGLNDLKAVYATVNMAAADNTVSVDPTSNVATIGSTAQKNSLTPEQLKAITAKAEEIRNGITK